MPLPTQAASRLVPATPADRIQQLNRESFGAIFHARKPEVLDVRDRLAQVFTDLEGAVKSGVTADVTAIQEKLAQMRPPAPRGIGLEMPKSVERLLFALRHAAGANRDLVEAEMKAHAAALQAAETTKQHDQDRAKELKRLADRDQGVRTQCHSVFDAEATVDDGQE